MIKLDKLILNNVGPYRYIENSNRDIEISDNCNSDYIFIHGSPTHGKTTFRNALSWLLCNKFSDDSAVGKYSDNHTVSDFINQNCVQFPDHHFFVKGELVDDVKNKRYVITKTINLKEKGIKNIEDLKNNPPDVNTNIKVIDLDTQENYHPQNPLKFLDNLFPSRLLDYFFVSGNDVKARLKKKDLAADFETILGLGAFNTLKSVLQDIKEDLASKNARDEKADKESKALNNAKETYKLELNGNDNGAEGKITELENVTREITNTENKRDNAISELSKYDECSKLASERDNIKAKIELKIESMRDDAEWLRARSSELWAIHAYNHVIVPMQDAPQIYNSADRTLIDIIDSITSHEAPSHIFQNLSDNDKAVLEEIVNLHKEKLDVDTSDISSFDKYKGADKEILKKTRNLAQNKNKLQELQIDLSVKTAEIANTPFQNETEEKKVKQAKIQLNGIEDLIESYRHKEQKLKAEIQVTQANLKEIEEKLSKNIEHLTAEEKKQFDVASVLIPVVEKSSDACKKAYRKTFETKANEIFEVVKNPKNPNDSLKIDEKYNLTITRPGLRDSEDQKTRELERKRESGSEGFIAATAVTLALSQLAVKHFPVVLDTPFEQGDYQDDLRLIDGWKEIKQQAIISFQKPKDGTDSPLSYHNLKDKFPMSKHYRLHKDETKEMSWFEEIK